MFYTDGSNLPTVEPTATAEIITATQEASFTSGDSTNSYTSKDPTDMSKETTTKTDTFTTDETTIGPNDMSIETATKTDTFTTDATTIGSTCIPSADGMITCPCRAGHVGDECETGNRFFRVTVELYG